MNSDDPTIPVPPPPPPKDGARGGGGWRPLAPDELARLLPQYRIEGLIGCGGMGAVYKGVQPSLDRPIAIKILPAEMAEDGQFIARFQREARTLASLQHPGIVAIYGFGLTSEGHPYIVMEFVDGTDLSEIIRSAALTPAQTLELTIQICEALQYAHSHGVMHRDIKPANILVGKDGRAKLADFGLARPVIEDHGTLTVSGVAMGTPAYMAPEQREGHGDHRADIYAVGVLLHEMLTGKRPEGIFDPASVNVQVDVRLDQVVIKAMQEEPERRYQHVSDLKADVDHIRNTPPPGSTSPVATSTVAPTRIPDFKRTARIKPLALAAAIVLLLLAIGGMFGWFHLRQRAAGATSQTTGPDRAKPSPENELEERRRVLGEEHPDTLNSMNSLAGIYQKQGKLTEAEPLYTKVLEVRGRVLGKDHPDTLSALSALSRLALFLRDQKKWEVAEPLLAKEMEFRRKPGGNQDAGFASTANNLGFVRSRMKHFAEAEAPLREALSVRQELMPDDWRRYYSEGRLGSLLLTLEKLDEAGLLLRSSYEGLKAHFATIPAANKMELVYAAERLARLAKSKDDEAEAGKWTAEALEVRRRVLGDVTPPQEAPLIPAAERSKTGGARIGVPQGWPPEMPPVYFLDLVGLLTKAVWSKLYRAPPPSPSADRLRVAFTLGGLIGDSFLVLQAKDVQQFRNTNQDILGYCQVLGLGDKVSPRLMPMANLAAMGKWGDLRQETVDGHQELTRLLREQRDEDLAILVDLGVWLRVLEVSSTLVAAAPEPSVKLLCIGSIDLLRDLRQRFSQLSQPAQQHESLVAVGDTLDFLIRNWLNPANNPPNQELVVRTNDKLKFLMRKLTVK